MPQTPDDSVHCRIANENDLDVLCRLENEIFDYDRMSRRSFARHIHNKNSAFILVAQINKVIVGYIVIFLRANSPKARVYSLAVVPGFRGKKIGHRLINNAIMHVKKVGKTIITLEVKTDNVPAIALYEHIGFKMTGIKKQYYQDQKDARKYQLDLF